MGELPELEDRVAKTVLVTSRSPLQAQVRVLLDTAGIRDM